MSQQPMPAQPVEEGGTQPQQTPPAQPQQTPPAQPQQTPPAQPQPQPAPAHPHQKSAGLESLFSQKLITLFVLIGVILLFVGAIIAVQAKVTEPVDADQDDINDAKQDAFTQYKTGLTVMVAGNLLIVMFLLCGAVTNEDLPVNVKVGFLIFCAILIFATVMLVLGFTGPLTNTGPDILE